MGEKLEPYPVLSELGALLVLFSEYPPPGGGHPCSNFPRSVLAFLLSSFPPPLFKFYLTAAPTFQQCYRILRPSPPRGLNPKGSHPAEMHRALRCCLCGPTPTEQQVVAELERCPFRIRQWTESNVSECNSRHAGIFFSSSLGSTAICFRVPAGSCRMHLPGPPACQHRSAPFPSQPAGPPPPLGLFPGWCIYLWGRAWSNWCVVAVKSTPLTE